MGDLTWRGELESFEEEATVETPVRACGCWPWPLFRAARTDMTRRAEGWDQRSATAQVQAAPASQASQGREEGRGAGGGGVAALKPGTSESADCSSHGDGSGALMLSIDSDALGKEDEQDVAKVPASAVGVNQETAMKQSTKTEAEPSTQPATTIPTKAAAFSKPVPQEAKVTFTSPARPAPATQAASELRVQLVQADTTTMRGSNIHSISISSSSSPVVSASIPENRALPPLSISDTSGSLDGGGGVGTGLAGLTSPQYSSSSFVGGNGCPCCSRGLGGEGGSGAAPLQGGGNSGPGTGLSQLLVDLRQVVLYSWTQVDMGACFAMNLMFVQN